jgi:hypothetical protein
MTKLMTKLFIRPLLLANYSLAVAITGWKVEKIFPRAILATCFQFYFLLSAGIIFFSPKIKSLEEMRFLGGELVVAGFVILLLFKPFATWVYIKLNVLARHKSRRMETSDISSSVAFSLVTLVIWFGSIAFELYKSIH